MKNKDRKNKDVLFGGIVVIVLATVLTLIFVALFGNDINSEAWFGFMGGLAGSILSSIATFYVLYINRKDMYYMAEENREETRSIQKENYELTMKGLEQQMDMVDYQWRMRDADEVMNLVSEFITIVEYYYIKMVDDKNAEEIYQAELARTYQICSQLHLKFDKIIHAGEVLACEADQYRIHFCERKPTENTSVGRSSQIKVRSRELRDFAQKACAAILTTDSMKNNKAK